MQSIIHSSLGARFLAEVICCFIQPTCK